MIKRPTLDIDLLRALVAVAERTGFTAAGSTLGATQSAVSVRVRKLEERLGRRLFERSPRSVRLTPFGRAFLEDARTILAAHDAAAARASTLAATRTFELAVSDHVAGALLPLLISALNARRPDVQFVVTVATSAALREGFRQGAFEAVLTRREAERSGGVSLHRDRLVWASAPGLAWKPTRLLPLVALAAPCELRLLATNTLTAAGITWREVFTGTGVAAVQAAVSAGLGVACLTSWNVPADCVRLEPGDGLPALPESEVVLHERSRGPDGAAIVADIADTFRATLASAAAPDRIAG